MKTIILLILSCFLFGFTMVNSGSLVSCCGDDGFSIPTPAGELAIISPKEYPSRSGQVLTYNEDSATWTWDTTIYPPSYELDKIIEAMEKNLNKLKQLREKK